MVLLAFCLMTRPKQIVNYFVTSSCLKVDVFLQVLSLSCYSWFHLSSSYSLLAFCILPVKWLILNFIQNQISSTEVQGKFVHTIWQPIHYFLSLGNTIHRLLFWHGFLAFQGQDGTPYTLTRLWRKWHRRHHVKGTFLRCCKETHVEIQQSRKVPVFACMAKSTMQHNK